MTGFGNSPWGGGPYGGGTVDEPEEFEEGLYPVPPGRPFGSVPLARFTGEPSEGVLSGARGLIFFSPALIEAGSTSEMEVASISVSARAFDRYRRPVERTGRLFRFGGGPTCVSPDWPSLTGSPLYRTQPLEYKVVATLVQTLPPGPTTVIKIP